MHISGSLLPLVEKNSPFKMNYYFLQITVDKRFCNNVSLVRDLGGVVLVKSSK